RRAETDEHAAVAAAVARNNVARARRRAADGVARAAANFHALVEISENGCAGRIKAHNVSEKQVVIRVNQPDTSLVIAGNNIPGAVAGRGGQAADRIVARARIDLYPLEEVAERTGIRADRPRAVDIGADVVALDEVA